MADVLLRNVDERTVLTLKAEAARNGRSLQAELLAAVQREAELIRRRTSFWEWADSFREELRKTHGPDPTDSARLRKLGRRGEE